MQKSLAVKSAELESKKQEANEKLKQMIKDQQVNYLSDYKSIFLFI